MRDTPAATRFARKIIMPLRIEAEKVDSIEKLNTFIEHCMEAGLDPI